MSTFGQDIHNVGLFADRRIGPDGYSLVLVRSGLDITFQRRDSGPIAKDRLAGGPALRQEYQGRTTLAVS